MLILFLKIKCFHMLLIIGLNNIYLKTRLICLEFKACFFLIISEKRHGVCNINMSTKPPTDRPSIVSWEQV